MCLHCFALTCKLKWDFDYNSSFLQRLPSGNRSCCSQNLISVRTFKQSSGGSSCGFTSIICHGCKTAHSERHILLRYVILKKNPEPSAFHEIFLARFIGYPMWHWTPSCNGGHSAPGDSNYDDIIPINHSNRWCRKWPVPVLGPHGHIIPEYTE